MLDSRLNRISASLNQSQAQVSTGSSRLMGHVARDADGGFKAQSLASPHAGDNSGNVWPGRWLIVSMVGVSILFLGLSSARHWLFQSTAFDLGIYDQVVYLMSRWESPISSFLGFHHLGNHAAWAVYPLGLLYAIHPSVYWLLAVQAVGLVAGMVPTWMLARQAGLSDTHANLMAWVYLSYPLIFNLNLFDFHPEVMAIAALIYAIWAARARQRVWFVVAIVWVLGCKDALSLTVAALGLWLLVFEKRRWSGAIALGLGTGWFLLVTQWMLPYFSGEEAGAVDRYSALGDSVLEIGLNVFLQPGWVLQRVWSLDTLQYVLKLTLPLLWGLSAFHLTPLIGGFPAFFLNLISEAETQRDLIHQYALPILPFLLVCVIDGFAARRTWLRHRRWIIPWIVIAFLYLSQVQHLPRRYTAFIDTLSANRQAVALIPADAAVLTDNRLAPHVTHRPMVKLIRGRTLREDLQSVDYVLLDSVHPWPPRQQLVERVLPRLRSQAAFDLVFEQDGVFLFERRALQSRAENFDEATTF